MESLFFCLGFFLSLVGFFGVFFSRSYLISFFLCLEVVVVGFILILLSEKSFLFCLSLLVVNGCEASSGLALTSAFFRSYGNTFIFSAKLLMV